jgi:hypothetical protein
MSVQNVSEETGPIATKTGVINTVLIAVRDFDWC